MQQSLRLYSEFAPWWPLLSSPDDYAEEAASLLRLLALPPSETPRTLLELGSGGGNLASHLTHMFRCTLSDQSEGMLAVSRLLNRTSEHVHGDYETLRLERTFDVVLIHDAIMYCTTKEALQRAITTAAVHCKTGGTVVLIPDFTRESFEPGTDCGGEDGDDGCSLRYLEWFLDPDANDDTIETIYTLVFRSPDGSLRVEHERHTEGIFPERFWLDTMHSLGLRATLHVDEWNRPVFVGRK